LVARLLDLAALEIPSSCTAVLAASGTAAAAAFFVLSEMLQESPTLLQEEPTGCNAMVSSSSAFFVLVASAASEMLQEAPTLLQEAPTGCNADNPAMHASRFAWSTPKDSGFCTEERI
jgi:hypothetical protein